MKLILFYNVNVNLYVQAGNAGTLEQQMILLQFKEEIDRIE